MRESLPADCPPRHHRRRFLRKRLGEPSTKKRIQNSFLARNSIEKTHIESQHDKVTNEGVCIDHGHTTIPVMDVSQIERTNHLSSVSQELSALMGPIDQAKVPVSRDPRNNERGAALSVLERDVSLRVILDDESRTYSCRTKISASRGNNATLVTTATKKGKGHAAGPLPEWKLLSRRSFYEEDANKLKPIAKHPHRDARPSIISDRNKYLDFEDNSEASSDHISTSSGFCVNERVPPFGKKRGRSWTRYPVPHNNDICLRDKHPLVVTPPCTCLAVTDDENSFMSDSSPCCRYFAVGDAHGYVTIFSLDPIVSSVVRLSTSASQRRADSFKLSTTQSAQRKVLRSLVEDALDNNSSIQSLAFSFYHDKGQSQTSFPRLCVCIGTLHEVELIDCSLNTVLWRSELSFFKMNALASGPSFRMKLDCHPTLGALDGGVVGSLWFRAPKVYKGLGFKIEELNLKSPLLIFNSTATSSSVIVKELLPIDAMEPFGHCLHNSLENATKLLPRAVAIWDRSKTNRILSLCAFTKTGRPEIGSEALCNLNSPFQKLICFDVTSMQVIYHVLVPAKIGMKCFASCALEQSKRGSLTMVASVRGIRVFRTEGLELLSSFGEGLSLHNHSISWQSCLFIPRQTNQNRTKNYVAKSITDKSKADTAESLADFLIAGVPHASREPRDLRDTIHLWDPILNTKLPAIAISAPPKSDGILSFCYASSAVPPVVNCMAAHRFLIVTQNGESHIISPSFWTDWAGKMYPPGYRLVEENMDYIEDEDEFDIAERANYEDSFIHGNHSIVADNELTLVLKRSLEDCQVDPFICNGKAAKIGEVASHSLIIPCKPEIDLTAKAGIQKGGDVEQIVSRRRNASSEFLSLLPQRDYVEDQLSMLKKSSQNDHDNSSSSKPLRNRKAKATFEFQLQSSINLCAKEEMAARKAWSDGSGSFPSRRNEVFSMSGCGIGRVPLRENCEGCQGRMVIHRCGRREKPFL